MTWRISIVAWAILAAVAAAQTVVRGPYLQKAAPDAVTVMWRTDVATDSVVSFGTTQGSLTSSVTDPTSTTDHVVRLTGLTPATRYFYSVGSTVAGLLAGDDADHFVTTHPPVGEATGTRIWVTGDTGFTGPAVESVRDAYRTLAGERGTDLWLMLGDNAYFFGTDSEYQSALFDTFEEDLRHTVLWSAIGNHDAGSADSATQTGVYFDIFDLPAAAEVGGVASGTEAYYSFDYANVHFVCLDSTDSDRSPTGAMLTWLQADLAANTQDWLIAFWHHPPYSRASNDSDADIELIEMRQNAVPILESHGVDLVLCGHSHVWERTALIDGHYGFSASYDPVTMALDPGDGEIGGTGAYRKGGLGPTANEGTVYTVAGSSSSVVSGPLDHPAIFRALPALGSVVLDVNGDQLDVLFLGSNGFGQDAFTIVKGGATPVETRFLAVGLSSTQWRYDDTGTDLGTAWRATAFNDAGWTVGTAILGYGEPFITTPVSFGTDAQNKHPTTYFRHTFNLAVDPALMTGLQLAAPYDDGFVAYLNGQEVLRKSMPAGVVGYTTLALPHETASYEVFDLSEHIGLLTTGNNVLAVEVHQATVDSDDLVWDGVIAYQLFEPFLGPCAAGTVGAGGGSPVDVLTVNGGAGGLGRSIDVTVNELFSIEIAQSPFSQPASKFSIFGILGTPGPADIFTLPYGLGDFCFTPALFTPGLPTSFILTDNFGPMPGTLLPSNPGAWSFSASLGAPTVFTLQGWMLETPTSVSVTNAVRVNVIP